MKYSIIIPTYLLKWEQFKKLVDSIYSYTDINIKDFEIIVVANGQSREFLEEARRDGRFWLVEFPSPLGYPKAVNEGIKRAKGDYIILLNDDTELLPQPINQWINLLEKPFWEDPTVGITGPLDGYMHEIGFHFIIFFCCMIKREVINRVGLLDEGFREGGGEDLDFCYRAIKAGFRFVRVPEDISLFVDKDNQNLAVGSFPIYHVGEATMKQLKENIYFEKIVPRNMKRLELKSKVFTLERGQFPRNAILPYHDLLRWLKLRERLLEFENEFGRKPVVMELGCGTGYGFDYIKDLVGVYIGVDYDKDVIEFCKIEYDDCENAYWINHNIIDLLGISFNRELDFIICFETLEHLEPDYFEQAVNWILQNSREAMITTPYNEINGEISPFHRTFSITEDSYKPFLEKYNLKFYFETWGGDLLDYNPGREVKLIYCHKPLEINEPKVLVYIVTKNRYFTTLPLTLMSLATQIRKPDKILIIDDGDHLDLTKIELYFYIFNLLDEKKIEWEVMFTDDKGQVNGHSLVNEKAKEWGFDLVWRIDDDEIAEPDVLWRMVDTIKRNENIVAVAPNCRLPNTGDVIKEPIEKNWHINIEDFYLPNIQWAKDDGKYIINHLYSTFIYKPGMIKYPYEFTKVGHREETVFSFELSKKGLLLVDNACKTYHFRASQGGIRTHQDEELWDKDEESFINYLKNQDIFKNVFWVYLPHGLGDTISFIPVLKEILEIEKDKRIIIGTAYPEVFEEFEQVKIVPVAVFQKLYPEYENLNVYKFMAENNWDKHIIEAYRRIYGI